MKKTKPLIQIALDTLTIAEAIKAAKIVEDYVDVIEVGTILLAAVGKEAISVLRAVFPNKIIVADMKIADAGSIFGTMAFEAGANFVTAICAADINTVKGLVTTAKKYSCLKPEVQIELTNNFTDQEAQAWLDAGATQIIYHRSRDAQASGVNWSEKDLNAIKKLNDLGFKVSVTGGIEVNDIPYFKDCSVYIFIAGRTLRGENALAEAKALKAMIDQNF